MGSVSKDAQGWGYPTLGARKEHWFPEGQVRSGCGKYGRFLPIEINDTRPLRKVCVACARAADAAGAA